MNNYLVTARKWRPQIFEDVVGQQHITQTLQNSIRSGKIAHAFIFSGPRGIGKTSTARILAKSLNCPNQKNYNPCNKCEICESITNGTNLDVIEIDGASNRRIDEIRTLRESAKYAPSTVKYKIYIIDEVHMLTNESFNALLKVLEEPPEHVIFIFATTDIHKVPATILSRCQRYEFRRLTTEEITQHLIKICQYENIQYEEDALRYIARRADGAMRDAQSLLDQLIVYSNGNIKISEISDVLNIIDIELYFEICDAILNRKIAEAFRIVNQIYFKGWELNTFLLDLIEHFRNILSVIVTDSTELIDGSEAIKERYRSFAKKFSSRDILRIISFLTKTQNELRQSSNPKLKLEIALAQLIELPKSVEIDDLINEIRKLINQPINQVQGGKSSVDVTNIKHQISSSVEQPKLELKNNSPSLESSTQFINKQILNNEKKINLNEVISKWEEFIQHVSKLNPDAAQHIISSKVVKNEKNNLFISVSNYEESSTFFEVYRDLFTKASQNVFGFPFRIVATKSNQPQNIINKNNSIKSILLTTDSDTDITGKLSEKEKVLRNIIKQDFGGEIIH